MLVRTKRRKHYMEVNAYIRFLPINAIDWRSERASIVFASIMAFWVLHVDCYPLESNPRY